MKRKGKGKDYRVEDARYSIGFSEEGTVDDGETGADAQSLDGAGKDHRFSQKGERVKVTEQNAAQQHEAQFTTRSLKIMKSWIY